MDEVYPIPDVLEGQIHRHVRTLGLLGRPFGNLRRCKGIHAEVARQTHFLLLPFDTLVQYFFFLLPREILEVCAFCLVELDLSQNLVFCEGCLLANHNRLIELIVVFGSNLFFQFSKLLLLDFL